MAIICVKHDTQFARGDCRDLDEAHIWGSKRKPNSSPGMSNIFSIHSTVCSHFP